MTERLDPLAAGADIEAGYKRYLKTLLAPRDPALSAAFDRAVDETSLLTKGPLLELTPPYAAGASLRSLISEGVLHPDFTEFAQTIALDRPLYQHQETAVRKAVAGRNLVVSTGTGSGKTESFLLPILNALIAEKAAGTLGPGVRALLLYPMNALANDQLKRLRQLLAGTPDITFGRYTGETKERTADALSAYRTMFAGAERLPNELLSREEMWTSPPNILLTNYAMLEYLLLRPRDMELFDGKYAQTWRFIALDEAHVYDGAQGSEVGLLLRRLRDRVAGDRPVQCIATSASLSGSTDDKQGLEATLFAKKLFDVPFEFVDGDLDRQDLITATRMPRRPEPTWQLDDDTLLRLAEPDADLAGIGANAATGDIADALHAERRTADLKKYARGGPANLTDLAAHLWPGDELAAAKLEALVAIGSKVTGADGNPVLSARYHLFVRATEGAFVSFTDDAPRVLLSRHEIDPVTGRAVFEFGTCQRCGAVHLAGEPQSFGGREYFRPAKRDSKVKWLVITDSDAADLVDEDDATLDEDAGADRSTGIRSLCSGCGRLDGGAGSCGLDCPGGPLLRVREHPGAQRIMSKCTECGARSRQVIRRLRTDTNAAPAVITTALYQNLPAADDETAVNVGGGRKLLMFSDSRQAAAFAAPYLAETYGRMLERRYLAHTLASPKYAGDELSPEDLADGARAVADAAFHFDENATRTAMRRQVNPWVMAELMAMDQRMSLEGLGLLAVSLKRPREFRVPAGFAKFGITDEEFWGLLDELVKTIRLQGAMSVLDDVDITHPIFEPRANHIWIRSRSADRNRRIISWLPGGKPGTTNNRILLVRKVLAAVGAQVDMAERVLETCWDFLLDRNFLAEQNDRVAGSLFQLDQNKLRIRPGAECDWYQCGACRRLTTHNIRDLCPQGNCDGLLTPFSLPDTDDTNHYRTAYRTMAMLPLSAAEHTAQWEATAAAEIQRNFVAGQVNVLSCSTTFELGVDVGDLQSVMLRNMPPKTANYVQRAGRAGRRAASAALVVTYAKRSSHDLSKFQNPESMIAGRMRIPWIPIDNDRIGRRHAHSIALAAYFRHCYDRYGKEWRQAGQFFTPEPGQQNSAAAQLRQFLSPVPESVRESLRAALPRPIQDEIGVEDDAWVGRLCDQLADAENDIRTDIATFDELISQATAERQFALAQKLQKTLETINKRQLLGYLANKNVLPKYGFPVDTVELRTSHCEGTVGARLELSRDLGQAIYDYAPGNQVVAGGKLWTSRGLHKLPKRELETLQYRVCKECNHFECGHVLDGPPVCSNCEAEFEQTKRCVLPEFGFVADRKPEDVKSEPPKRSWFGASYVEHIGESVELPPWRASTGVEVRARSGTRARLAVIGEGSGGGFLLCEWCGWADPFGPNRAKSKGHHRPATGIACSGPLEVVSLAHRYETDVAEITFSTQLAYTRESEARWLSVLYALLEGASEALEISRDDIDGTLSWSADGRRSIVLFDTVPAGAGASKQIAGQLDLVLRAAADRVAHCDCGIETSCYGCLRSFRNERFHDRLTREGALAVFGGIGLPGEEKDAVARDWDLAPGGMSEVVRALLAELAEAGVPQPEIGIEEGRHYWPVELAWPSSKVVVVEGLDSDRDSGLSGDGYHVIAIESSDAAKRVSALVAIR
ncbi:DEAD/DEAH box helicase [Nocardia lasii]|uniref:DEAD/DEAH box helicase n=1 Tax=Nocardia lasii TaxID=1616107 RepID=A0ABW1JV50_9NOCA